MHDDSHKAFEQAIRQWAEQHPEQWAELERRLSPAARSARQAACAAAAAAVPPAAPLTEVELRQWLSVPPLLPSAIAALVAAGQRPPSSRGIAKADDQALLDEGRALMAAQGITAWAATAPLASRAKGRGNEDSKRRRLWRQLKRSPAGAV